jgi:2-polyprenyl-3-methyl-5-hydroxy-6-metoxy-1,4-benzoquinol methylase
MANERIERVVSELTGTQILHVGCVGQAEGRYRLHEELCQRLPEAEILGLDIDAVGVAELRRRGYSVIIGDGEEMPFQSRFDSIAAGELIEHLSNPGEFLRACHRALKPKGRVVITTPNPFALMHGLMYTKNFNRAFNSEHALWLCPQTLAELARRCGFQVRKIEFVDDLSPDMVPSFWYKAFAHVWKGLRVLLPVRFRNTIFAVLEPV